MNIFLRIDRNIEIKDKIKFRNIYTPRGDITCDQKINLSLLKII